MKSIERVFAAISGDSSDHPPFALTLSLYGAKLIDTPLDRYFSDASAYAQGQQAVADLIDPDILFSPFKLTAITEAFGGNVRVYEDAPPNMRSPGFKTAEDAAAFDFSEAADHPSIRYLIDATEKTARNLGADKAIAGIFLSPVDLPALIIGIDRWLETVLFEPSVAEKLCRKCGDFFEKMVARFFDAGVNFIALPMVFCNPAIVTKRVITELSLPFLQEYFKRVGGALVIHHGGAPIFDFIDTMAGLPNVAAIVLDHKDSFSKCRASVGGGMVLMGNIDGPTLHRATPDKIEARCSAILTERADDSHFIFASSSADIPLSTPLENIMAVVHSVRSVKRSGHKVDTANDTH